MLQKIEARGLPEGAMLAKVDKEIMPFYTDCFSIKLNGIISIEAFIEAFYTSAIFKIERKILGVTVRRPSTDIQAIELSKGLRDDFSAWNLEYRDKNQVVLSDFMGRTKSWLMVEKKGHSMTQLFFGSAVMPNVKPDGTQIGPSILFTLLGGFHRTYSRLLLWSATRELLKSTRKEHT